MALQQKTFRRPVSRAHRSAPPRSPGSGWVLANIDLPSDIDLTLVDLNASSLEHTASRLDVSPTLIEHDVMLPLPENVDSFDSVSINYVLHCLPGDWSTKSAALTNLADALAPDEVLFGSTVIGVDQKYTTLGAALMFVYNRIGAFGNRDDDLPGLRQLLSDRFEHVDITMVGNVALFVAKNPLDAQQQTD
ncbi:class I SAM-dependent methyltransferase [Rhodococcoides navarretei]|uniref:Class I SAM-dependent methyltransferase n=1 Tax=Rhodococcus navarretei TaxID=3128981 RepID=A0ABU9CYT9_9NOCA